MNGSGWASPANSEPRSARPDTENDRYLFPIPRHTPPPNPCSEPEIPARLTTLKWDISEGSPYRGQSLWKADLSGSLGPGVNHDAHTEHALSPGCTAVMGLCIFTGSERQPELLFFDVFSGSAGLGRKELFCWPQLKKYTGSHL